jgi:hypothetical protein
MQYKRIYILQYSALFPCKKQPPPERSGNLSINFIYTWFALFFIFAIMLAFSLVEFAKRTVNPVSRKISLSIYFISSIGIIVLYGTIFYQFFKIFW